MSQKALTALVFVVAGLLAIVVVVGLTQRLLDPTGVAVALASLLGGVVVGARGISNRRGGSGDDS